VEWIGCYTCMKEEVREKIKDREEIKASSMCHAKE
jgi:hypothetical protein